MAFAEDLGVFFSADEFALQATFTLPGRHTATAAVLLDSPTEDVLGGKAQSNEYVMTLPAAAFPGLTRGHTVTIAGTEYLVRESPDLIGDGAIKRVKLTKQ